MIQKLTPEDNQDDDNAIHKQIRAITQETIDTADGREFSVQQDKKDDIPSKVYKAGRNPTPLHNSNLRVPNEMNFPQKVKKQ